MRKAGRETVGRKEKESGRENRKQTRERQTTRVRERRVGINKGEESDSIRKEERKQARERKGVRDKERR